MSEKDLEKENAELRKDKEELCHVISAGAKVCLHLNEHLEYAKVIIQDLLNNSDEYARQRAIDWLEEIEKCLKRNQKSMQINTKITEAVLNGGV